MLPKSILTIDQAKLSGFCNWKPGNKPVLSSLDLRYLGNDLGKVLSYFEKNLRKNLVDNEVDFVCFEDVYIKHPVNIKVLKFLFPLFVAIDKICFEMNIPCYVVTPTQWRNCAFGKGKYKRDVAKAKAIETCRQFGFNPQCEDEAEAFCIMVYVATIKRLPKDWSEPGLLNLT